MSIVVGAAVGAGCDTPELMVEPSSEYEYDNGSEFWGIIVLDECSTETLTETPMYE